MITVPEKIKIPKNIADFIKNNDGVNLAINFNSAFADDGYAHAIHHSVVISMLTRTCHHCGYDPIWKPDDTESKCQRHRYNAWRYDEVFIWAPNAEKPLDKCFDIWLKEYISKKWNNPVKEMIFGKIGWW